MKRLLGATVAVLVLGAFLGPAACKSKAQAGSSATPPAETPAVVAAAAPAGPDACALLEKDEVKTIVGHEVTDAGHGGSGATNVCEYKLAGGSEVMLSVYATSGKETFDAAPGVPLAGIGDQAKWAADAKMLAVLHGTKSFAVGLMIFDDTPDEKIQEQVKALATAILGRL